MARRRNQQFLHHLGARIQQARNAARLTQEQLAERVGLQAATISRIEGGHIGPTVSTLAEMADALGCRVGELLDVDAPAPSPTPVHDDERAALLRAWDRALPERRELLLRVINEFSR